MQNSEHEAQPSQFDEELLEANVNNLDWSDVPPMPQPCNTLYGSILKSPSAIYLHYLQHLCQHNQLSGRTMALTQYLLVNCTSNYYASLLRLNCIRANPSHISRQRRLNRYLLTLNNREYQLWNYRKQLQPQLNREQELQMISDFLSEDSKNYHVWSYLTWLTEFIGNYQEELNRINSELNGDNFRKKQCYSLWSYRRWLIEKTNRLSNAQFLQQQIQWLCTLIRQNPMNQCLWVILNGYQQQDKHILELCDQLHNRFSLYTLYLQHQHTQKGLELLKQLEEEDLPRKAYWKHRQEIDKYQ